MSPGLWHWACCCGVETGTILALGQHKTTGNPLLVYVMSEFVPLGEIELTPPESPYTYVPGFPMCKTGAESLAMAYRDLAANILRIGTSSDSGATWTYELVKVSGADVVVNYCRYIAEDSDGKLWVAAQRSSTSRYSVFRRDAENDWAEYALTNYNVIFDLAKNKDTGHIWTWHQTLNTTRIDWWEIGQPTDPIAMASSSWSYRCMHSTAAGLMHLAGHYVYTAVTTDPVAAVWERTGAGTAVQHSIVNPTGETAKCMEHAYAIDTAGGKHVVLELTTQGVSGPIPQLWYAYAAEGSWVWTVRFFYSFAEDVSTYPGRPLSITTTPDEKAVIAVSPRRDSAETMKIFVGGISGETISFTEYNSSSNAQADMLWFPVVMG